MYHFITGYTAKVAGTEVGIKEPVPSFSACFGEAFIPLHPYRYAKLLAEKVTKYNTKCWLVNSGWSGGAYPEGDRMSLKITRSILNAIHDGTLEKGEFENMPVFNLKVPTSCKNVDSKVLMPSKNWESQDKYNDTLRKLAGKFQKNFERYQELIPKEVIEAGPQL